MLFPIGAQGAACWLYILSTWATASLATNNTTGTGIDALLRAMVMAINVSSGLSNKGDLGFKYPSALSEIQAFMMFSWQLVNLKLLLNTACWQILVLSLASCP